MPFVPCTVLTCDITIHTLKGKKKGGGGKKRKRGFGNADPNPHLLGNVGTSQKFEMKKLP